MEYIKVKDKENLLRDSHSNGIVNSDTESYRNYINEYTRKINSNKKIEILQEQVDTMKNDISEIKELLLKILNS